MAGKVPILGPNGETVKTVHYDEPEDRLYVNVHQDVEEIIEDNKAAQTSGNDGYWKNRAAKHVGEIPDVVLYQWLIDDGLPPNLYQAIPDKKERSAWLLKKLRDPDNRFFRVAPGRI